MQFVKKILMGFQFQELNDVKWDEMNGGIRDYLWDKLGEYIS